MKKCYILLVLILVLFGCTKNAATKTSSKLNLYVSIAPQKFLVSQICGDLAECSILVPNGKSPETYEPTSKDIVTLSYADAFFTIGVPFEKTFIPKIKQMMPNLQICDITLNLVKRNLEAHHHDGEEEHEHHHHDGEEEHEHHHHHHGTIDPHVWVSPTNMIIMGQSILESVILLDSLNEKIYKENFNNLCEKISTIETYASQQLKPYWGKNIFVSHPAFGYFTDEFGLTQISIEFNGKEATSATLVNVIDFAKKESLHTIFVQPEFSKKSAASIAQAINGNVVELNPLDENYLEMIKDMTDKIVASFN